MYSCFYRYNVVVVVFWATNRTTSIRRCSIEIQTLIICEIGYAQAAAAAIATAHSTNVLAEKGKRCMCVPEGKKEKNKKEVH